MPKTFRSLAWLALWWCGLAAAADDPQGRKARIEAIEQRATPAALERKARSEARLTIEGVPVNRGLPAIEDVAQVRKRSKEEVARRAMALLIVASKGSGLGQAAVEHLVKKNALQRHLSPAEAAFVRNLSPSQHELAQFSWRYEAAWTLLWALGYVEQLEMPTSQCDVGTAVDTLFERDAKAFIAQARLRSIEDIVEAADRIYRYHWAVVDARIKGLPAPAALEAGVVLERHHALNWLIGYLDQEWDEVTTDT